MNFPSMIYSAQLRARQWIVAARYGLFAKPSEPISRLSIVPEKVIVIVAGLIGDTVMCTPAIAQTKVVWPDCELTLLGKKHNCDLLSADPHIDAFYSISADPFSLRGLAEVRALRKWLHAETFDVAIILLGDQFAHILADARIPIRVGVSGTRLAACLTHTYDIRSPREWGANERLRAFQSLGYEPPDLQRARLYISDDAREAARVKLKLDRPYAVVHPFGSTHAQWWPIDRIEKLAGVLRERGLETVVVGKSYSLNGEVTSPLLSAAMSEQVINTIDRLTLTELMGTVANAELVVTTDSGPFHIAGALGKPIVGMFRHRRPEHANAYSTAVVVFGTDSACTGNCEWDRCSVVPCRQMSNLSTDEVLMAVREIQLPREIPG